MKMNELLLNDECFGNELPNNIYNDEWYWKVIENIKWFYLARDHGKEANDKVAEFLLENQFSINEIINIHNFVVRQREIVKNFIHGYLRGCPSYTKEKYKLGDDSTWDLASHIVGMGKQMVDLVLGNPELIFCLQNIKQENFEYGFDKAIYEIQNKEEI